jgi:hypothetical protein
VDTTAVNSGTSDVETGTNTDENQTSSTASVDTSAAANTDTTTGTDGATQTDDSTATTGDQTTDTASATASSTSDAGQNPEFAGNFRLLGCYSSTNRFISFEIGLSGGSVDQESCAATCDGSGFFGTVGR